ncbi:MAG: type II toxin-antitoxin system HipA family toxin [Chlorobiaceae bacterium]|nr:type II toxin-antitoxin system HipA family toxin [Chlorobiaceae bacterium]
MIRKITVHERTTGTPLPVGVLVSEINDLGRARCQFRYQEDYLLRDDAFPIDPVSLPLRSGVFTAERKVIFDVLEDSLPDDWGRKLLIRRHHLPKGEQNPVSLLEGLGSEALGALSFTADTAKPQSGRHRSEIHSVMANLGHLIDAVEHYERGDSDDLLLSLLLSSGSSPGGARPKVLVSDEQSGSNYLAKFPSISDKVDVVRIEGATMSLAAKAGINTAPSRVILCTDRPVLLVERFDLMPGDKRRHMISFRSLLRAEAYYVSRYDELHGIIRKYSTEPARDAEQLFRQMLFNALIGNTDDHLKNFWMTCGQREGWRLSPAFDLVPNIAQRSEHILIFELDPRHPGRSALAKLGRTWAISNSNAIIDELYAVVQGWKTEFSKAGVCDEEIEQFREIDKNLLR